MEHLLPINGNREPEKTLGIRLKLSGPAQYEHIRLSCVLNKTNSLKCEGTTQLKTKPADRQNKIWMQQ